MRPPLLLLVLLTCVAGCSGAAQLPDDPPVEPVPLRFELLGQQPRRTPLWLHHLSGRNKQADIDLRFRRQVPDDTPAYVDRQHDGLDLFVADATPGGWLAFYKGRCGDLADVCDYHARLYAPDSSLAWDLDLNRFLAADRSVEIQDVRLHDGWLYFNEACAAYAREAEYRCSSLLRVDPVRRQVDWRTPHLVSNDVFILQDAYVVAGYGFTAEPDSLYLLRQRDGRIVDRVGIDSAHDYLEFHGDTLSVVTYNSVYTFALTPALPDPD